MARLRKTADTSLCTCHGTGWIELMDQKWTQCPDHFKGQLHPETYNLLADEPTRVAEEEKKAKLHFQIGQLDARIFKLQEQIKIAKEKMAKLESELINRTATVRAMSAVRLDALDEPEVQIVDIADLDDEEDLDLSWDELDYTRR